jgi:hypothetical protein
MSIFSHGNSILGPTRKLLVFSNDGSINCYYLLVFKKKGSNLLALKKKIRMEIRELAKNKLG